MKTAQAIPELQDQLLRPTQGLLGWMEPDRALLFLTGNQMGVEVGPEGVEHAAKAREQVGRRTPAESGWSSSTLPPELAEHMSRFATCPDGAVELNAGWQATMVDLSKVRTLQRFVFTDGAALDSGISRGDLVALAEYTLPAVPPPPLPARFDPVKGVWTVVSMSANLRVVSPFGGAAPDGSGAMVLGFAVRERQSYVKAGEYSGNLYLLDGHHRAVTLLRAGITKVPVLVKHLKAIAELAVPDPLPQESYLGKRPPFLPDYLDSEVTGVAQLPATQRVILVQALELSPTLGTAQGGTPPGTMR